MIWPIDVKIALIAIVATAISLPGNSAGQVVEGEIALLCVFVYIDGPLLLRYDHPNGLRYQRGVAGVFDSRFWG